MKNMIAKYRDHLILHWVVFIWGFTAVLGKIITLPAIDLVWFRMLIAVISFLIYLKFKKIPLRVNRKQFLQFTGTGLIVAIHWISFFGAIKLSNISVTLGTLSTVSLFVAFLEPWFFRKKITALEVIASLVIIAGLYVIFQFEFHYLKGILAALLCAFLAALFTVINKKFVEKSDSLIISTYEMLGGFIGITIYLLATRGDFLSGINIRYYEWLSLIALGTICTAYAFTTSVRVMENLSAYYVTLSVNMEPVYGIIMAYLFFTETETMSPQFYLGAIVILITVVGYPFLKRRDKVRKMNYL